MDGERGGGQGRADLATLEDDDVARLAKVAALPVERLEAEGLANSTAGSRAAGRSAARLIRDRYAMSRRDEVVADTPEGRVAARAEQRRGRTAGSPPCPDNDDGRRSTCQSAGFTDELIAEAC